MLTALVLLAAGSIADAAIIADDSYYDNRRHGQYHYRDNDSTWFWVILWTIVILTLFCCLFVGYQYGVHSTTHRHATVKKFDSENQMIERTEIVDDTSSYSSTCDVNYPISRTAAPRRLRV
jgi:hypothetical protein